MTFRLNTSKILFTRLGEEGVIYDIERNVYFSLNETLVKILEYIDTGHSLTAITRFLCEEYCILEDRCRQEVADAVAALVELQVVISTTAQ